jgi:hypothetical protein
LVPKKIKVDPSVGAAPFLACENLAVKAARFIQIRDIEGEMEQAFHARQHTSLSGALWPLQPEFKRPWKGRPP